MQSLPIVHLAGGKWGRERHKERICYSEGTSAENIDAQCDDLGRQFAVFEALRTQHPGLWQGISSEEEGEEGRQAAFAQAVNWVRSRGFTVGGEPLLLPAFDMLNHDPHRAGATFLQEEEGNGDSDGTGEVFKLVATRPLVANEEIFRSFGPLSNAMLLESYGFILEDNVFDRVIIPRHMVEHCLKQQEQTKQLVGKTTDSQSVDESDSTTQVFHMANKKNTGQGYILSKYNPVSEDLVADVQHHLDTVDLERVYQVVWNVLGAKEASYAKANKETNCCASVGTDALQIVHWLVQQEKSVLHRARQQIEEQGFFFDTSSCFNDSPRKANPEDDSSNKRPKIC